MLVFSALAALFGDLAHAAPRRVVVLNLAADGAAGASAAAAVRADLDRRAELDPLPTGLLASALEGKLPATSPDQDIVAGAQELLRDAREAYATRGAFDEAIDGLRLAQSKLVRVPPVQEVRALWAEISVELGVVALAKQDRTQALESFRLARAFDPARTDLDPAVYDPEAVKVFAEAGKPRAPTASIAVTTDYDAATMWIDGTEVAGRSAALAPGIHVITAAYPDHRSAGQRVTVVDGPPQEVSLPLERLPVHDRAEALRRRLLADPAPPPTVWLDAARDAATLTGHDVVVVIRTSMIGRSEAALWERSRDRLGHWLPLAGKKSIAHLLAPLLPRAITPVGPGVGPIVTPPPPLRWWQRSEFQLGGVATAILAVGITAALLSNGGGDKFIDGSQCGFTGC
ncbi:MAG TPA: hypothetical protein VL172_13745 [Kofleriaceae bacterium]|nr:hypothetical protein [Kofleriaceae bacterium]